jgi:hypothetical protein
MGCSRRIAVLTVSSSINENTWGASFDSRAGSGAAAAGIEQNTSIKPSMQDAMGPPGWVSTVG